jgi:hypothetical protein
MKQFFFRAATYAEDERELAKLDAYVASRRWDPASRTYGPNDWDALVADAASRQFDAICASFDGRWWFSAVTSLASFERVLPKRGQEKGPPKGGVIGGRPSAEEFACRLIADNGPKTLEEIIDAVVKAQLGKGSVGSIRNIVRFALKGSDRLVCRTDRDRVLRWRHRQSPKANAPQPNSSPGSSTVSAAQLHAFAQVLADGIVQRLLAASPDQLQALVSRATLP